MAVELFGSKGGRGGRFEVMTKGNDLREKYRTIVWSNCSDFFSMLVRKNLGSSLF